MRSRLTTVVEHKPVCPRPSPGNSGHLYQCQGEVLIECEHDKVSFLVLLTGGDTGKDVESDPSSRTSELLLSRPPPIPATFACGLASTGKR